MGEGGRGLGPRGLCYVSHITGGSAPSKLHGLGKDFWEARQGAGAALVSRGTSVPLSAMRGISPRCPGTCNVNHLSPQTETGACTGKCPVMAQLCRLDGTPRRVLLRWDQVGNKAPLTRKYLRNLQSLLSMKQVSFLEETERTSSLFLGFVKTRRHLQKKPPLCGKGRRGACSFFIKEGQTSLAARPVSGNGEPT